MVLFRRLMERILRSQRGDSGSNPEGAVEMSKKDALFCVFWKIRKDILHILGN
jgi:hypothetical protein